MKYFQFGYNVKPVWLNFHRKMLQRGIIDYMPPLSGEVDFLPKAKKTKGCYRIDMGIIFAFKTLPPRLRHAAPPLSGEANKQQFTLFNIYVIIQYINYESFFSEK